jgi:hypothetical protein
MDNTSDLQRELDRTQIVAAETPVATSSVPNDDVVLSQTPVVTESHQLIEQVREGMKVIDVNGDDIGKVAAMKMGDPDTATVSTAEETPEDTLLDRPLVAAPAVNYGTGVLAAPIVPAAVDDGETIDENLLRTGYIRVDAKGWFSRDLLVPADAIASVTADSVTISLAKDDLAKE